MKNNLNSQINKSENECWRKVFFYSLCLFFVIIVIPLLHPSVSFDGIIYASIAKNLNLGYGTLWRPMLSEAILNPFYEHPPLALYFQSLFFKILGPRFEADQIYALCMAVSQFGLIAWYWLKNQKAPQLSLGLLLLLWLIIPLNWHYIDNYLIASLTLFTTMAGLLLLVNVESKLGVFFKYLCCSILILIAFLCDGPAAFFPLAIPLIRRVINKPTTFYIGIFETILLLCMLVAIFCFYYWWVPDAFYNSQQFIKQQVLTSINGTRGGLNATGFYNHIAMILQVFFKNYIAIFIVGMICVGMAAKIKSQTWVSAFKTSFSNKTFLLFLAIALAAALPTAVSCRIHSRYIIPSAPFFNLAMMWLCFQPFKEMVTYYSQRSLLFKYQRPLEYLLFGILFISIGMLKIVQYQQSDFPKVAADIHKIIQYCEQDNYCSQHSILSIDQNNVFDYENVLKKGIFYLSRYANQMITVTREPGFAYYLGFKNDPIPKGYHSVGIPLSLLNFAVIDTPVPSIKTAISSPSIQFF